MKWKAITILFIILASLVPIYSINKYLQNILRPRESLARLFSYLLSGMILVFLYTLLLVFIIKWMFPNA
ncbi:MAG TPA: hypothetical protein VFP87_08180 [Chitinophagaceae bacterium]|nr:hypothetical protein [Chitinophagaceae bacterium]